MRARRCNTDRAWRRTSRSQTSATVQRIELRILGSTELPLEALAQFRYEPRSVSGSVRRVSKLDACEASTEFSLLGARADELLAELREAARREEAM